MAFLQQVSNKWPSGYEALQNHIGKAIVSTIYESTWRESWFLPVDKFYKLIIWEKNLAWLLDNLRGPTDRN